MSTITQFEHLEIWQEARGFSNKIYKLTSGSSFRKEFALVDQMRRSSGSIMDNIAEGFGRGGRNEFINFLSYARGSVNETRSQLYRTLDNGLLDDLEFESLKRQSELLEIKLNNFISYLQKSAFDGNKFKKRKT